MILDGLLMFTGGTGGIGNSNGRTDSPTTGTQVSSNVIDIGIEDGIPESARGGGARDLGIGDKPAMKMLVQVTTAFTDGTSLQCTIEGAPDNGSGAPGSYTIMYTSLAVVEANLTIGARIAEIDLPRVIVGQPMPRFLRLTFITVGTHSLGAVCGTMVLDRYDQPQANAGGYPAGLNVAN